VKRHAGHLGALVGFPVLAVLLGTYRGGELSQFLVLGAVVSALALTWGIAGILNLGHSITFAVGVYAGAWFGLHTGGAGTVLGVLAGTILGGLVAWAIALVTLRRRLDAITVTLTTFVLALAAEDIANQWTAVTGGFNGLYGVPAFHIGALQLTVVQQRAAGAAIAVAVLIGLASLARRPYGAALAACRDDERRMASLGYDVLRLQVGVFTLTGGLAGFLGSVYVGQVQFASPTFAGATFATNFVIWALLGSRRSIWGPVFATVAYNVGAVELSGAALNYWLLTVGVLFVAAVLFVPQGGASLLRRWTPRSWRKSTAVSLGLREAGTRSVGTLEAISVSCRFGALVAVDDVSLVVGNAGVHCLIGPNGAGKSTLLDVLSGITEASGGTWRLGGADVTGMSPWVLAKAGLGRKFQSPSVGTSLTVAENLALASWARTHGSIALARQDWHASLPAEAWDVLTAGGLTARLETTAGDLSHGQRQLLELAMTLSAGCDILLLDEPTAGMTQSETSQVALLLRHLAKERNLPILVVEHDMVFIRDVAEEVTVMRNGSIMLTGTIADIESSDEVRSVYLGRDPVAER
jgi:branched-chain amino acid transport system permease protein